MKPKKSKCRPLQITLPFNNPKKFVMRKRNVSIFLFIAVFSLATHAQTVLKIPFNQPTVFSVTPSSIFTLLPETGNIRLGLDAKISGGSGKYTYQWTSGEQTLGTESTLTVDKAGIYLLLVKDEKGCQSSILYTVTGSAALTDAKKQNLKVWPNPSKGPVSIQTKTMTELENIILLTPDGKTIANYSKKDLKIENNSVTLMLDKLPKGYYVLSVQYGKETLTQAILLQ